MRAVASLGVAALLAQTIAAASAQDVARTAGESGTDGALGASSDGEAERVLALSSDLAYGEYLAGECVTCHVASPSATSKGDAVPVIGGIEASRIVRALLEYRSGRRPNTTMGNVAGSLGDEEIAVLAQYLSAVEQ